MALGCIRPTGEDAGMDIRTIDQAASTQRRTASAAAAGASDGADTDATIRASVEKLIAALPTVARHPIGATVQHGVLTLTGTVDRAFQRQTLIELARATRGVRAVISRVDLRAERLSAHQAVTLSTFN
jgi:osmotically-inducible protein OsmY